MNSCEGENLLKPSEVPHSMYESMLEIQNKLKLYNGWKITGSRCYVKYQKTKEGNTNKLDQPHFYIFPTQNKLTKKEQTNKKFN